MIVASLTFTGLPIVAFVARPLMTSVADLKGVLLFPFEQDAIKKPVTMRVRMGRMGFGVLSLFPLKAAPPCLGGDQGARRRNRRLFVETDAAVEYCVDDFVQCAAANENARSFINMSASSTVQSVCSLTVRMAWATFDTLSCPGSPLSMLD
jgi:hypothetical protein